MGSGVPCRVFDVAATPGKDIAPALQAAIDRAGAAGGGVVRIPAGAFVLGQSVAVPHDRVSVEGAGSALTRLTVPASYDQTERDYDEGVITLGRRLDKWRQGWWNNTAVIGAVRDDVPAGGRRLVVEDAALLAEGQWVVVVQYLWPALAAQFSGPGEQAWPSILGWPAAGEFDRRYAFAYLRQITGLDGNVVTVDAPFPRTLRPADNPIRLRDPQDPAWTAPRAQLGVSGLHIRFDDNRNGKKGRPGGTGILVDSVRDAWVHDVHVENFPRFGIRVTHAARTTVSSNAVVDMQDDGRGGFGYAYSAFASQNILFLGNHAEEVRRGFTITHLPSSVIVLSGNTSLATRATGDDTHHSPAQWVVFDDHRMGHGTGLAMINRGPKSDRAFETAWGGVVWNASGDDRLGGYYGGAVLMNPMAGSQAFVVGVTGMGVHDMGPGSRSGNPRAMHTVPPKAGLQLGHAAGPPGPGSFDRNVLYEGIGQPGLQPRSLFAAQLRARTGQSPPAFAGGCGRQPVQAPVVPRRAPAPGLLFDSDHLGSVAMPGSGCVDCDVDSTQRNHTPGGQESARLVFKPENWALGLRLRGAAIRTDRMDRLVLQVFPTRAAFRLRVTVGTVELDNQRRKGRGHETHVVTDPLHPNQWNTVVIPRPQITTPEFNTIGLSAVGPESAGEFFLDDVQVVFDRPGGQSLSQPAP